MRSLFEIGDLPAALSLCSKLANTPACEMRITECPIYEQLQRRKFGFACIVEYLVLGQFLKRFELFKRSSLKGPPSALIRASFFSSI